MIIRDKKIEPFYIESYESGYILYKEKISEKMIEEIKSNDTI